MQVRSLGAEVVVFEARRAGAPRCWRQVMVSVLVTQVPYIHFRSIKCQQIRVQPRVGPPESCS